MSSFKREFQLLLKIRSIRADKAERELAVAEARRAEATDNHNKAASQLADARSQLRHINENRFPKQSALLSGGEIRKKATVARQAEAHLQDRVTDYHSATYRRDDAERGASIAREAHNLSQRIVIKTEAIIDELAANIDPPPESS